MALGYAAFLRYRHTLALCGRSLSRRDALLKWHGGILGNAGRSVAVSCFLMPRTIIPPAMYGVQYSAYGPCPPLYNGTVALF